MSSVKRMMEEREARGYEDVSHIRVCARCVRDNYLRSTLERSQTHQRCSFCSSTQSADFSVLLDCLVSTMHHYYTDPAEELPYESAEGGYQGETLNTLEVLQELGEWTDRDALLDQAAESIDDTLWCRQDYFGLTQYEQLQYGWDEFLRQVRHKTRHLFFSKPTSWHSQHSDGLLPQDMLQQLGALFCEYGLFTTLDQPLKRARIVKIGERPATAEKLGTAPEHLANMANRMSPAGIPMFYAGLDVKTAIAETYEPRRGRGREIAMATFQPVRPLRMLDLRRIPAIPSLFDPDARERHDPIRFLDAFATDLRKPVKRDHLAHTEYVGTQVVTEYVRHRLTDNGTRIDGIVYRSSRLSQGVAAVVFATSEQCQDSGSFGSNQQILRLVDVEYMPPPRRGPRPL